MSERAVRRIRRAYAVLLSCAVAGTGLSAAVACVLVCRGGPSPFTAARVRAYAGVPLALLLLSACLAAAGVLLPPRPSAAASLRDGTDALAFLRRGRDASALPEAGAAVLVRERRLRRRLRLLSAALGAGLSVRPLAYCLNPARFPGADVDREVLSAALRVLPAAILSLALALLAGALCRASARREAEALGLAPPAASRTVRRKGARSLVLRAAAAALAVALIVCGAAAGGAADVLGKAARLCAECIGLG